MGLGSYLDRRIEILELARLIVVSERVRVRRLLQVYLPGLAFENVEAGS